MRKFQSVLSEFGFLLVGGALGLAAILSGPQWIEFVTH